MQHAEPQVHRWKRDEYYRLADVGILKPEERVELIEGVIYVRHPRPEPRSWTKDEYYRMAALGLLEGLHVELIEGRIVEMSPQLSRHAAAVGIVADALEAAFGAGHVARRQAPLDLEASEPEPDVAIVPGTHRNYAAAHPRTAMVIVEASESSLRYDQTDKASLYARAGIADYWIVNLIDYQLEIRRRPVADDTQSFGCGYAEITIRKDKDAVSPLVVPQVSITAGDLLP